MKTYISLFTLVLVSLSCFSQNLTYDQVKAQTKKKIKIKDIPTFKSYKSKDGFVYSIGDTINLGLAKSGNLFKNLYLYKSVLSMSQLPSTYQNKAYLIKEISSANNSVSMTLELGMGGVMKNHSIRTFDFETAVLENEIKRNGMTSDEALEELKKWKSKLDLELITQEEYDAKKAELSEFIK